MFWSVVDAEEVVASSTFNSSLRKVSYIGYRSTSKHRYRVRFMLYNMLFGMREGDQHVPSRFIVVLAELVKADQPAVWPAATALSLEETKQAMV